MTCNAQGSTESGIIEGRYHPSKQTNTKLYIKVNTY